MIKRREINDLIGTLKNERFVLQTQIERLKKINLKKDSLDDFIKIKNDILAVSNRLKFFVSDLG